jgi:DNA helicase-2/ATP-dependent DNA helicase PcrA
MLEATETPESESRLSNLEELVNAAVEAAERGEGVTEFLDHAALVADSDNLDERAEVSLLTMHNAKGLEFPYVFIAGLEEGLFPHTRSLQSPEGMEEERRLCYVGMTRAEKRLILTHAKFRRKFGGSPPERAIPSRFLKEVPAGLTEKLGRGMDVPQVDLFSEQYQVRETVKKNLYTGKTVNSVDNISRFFAEKGIQPKAPVVAAPLAPPVKAVAAAPAAAPYRPGMQTRKKPFGAGAMIRHPKYGRGQILKREGDGEDAKLTVSFPGYGLKKLIEKYAGIKEE